MNISSLWFSNLVISQAGNKEDHKMNSYLTKAVTPLKKAFSLFMVTCLIFTLFAIAAPGEASAASATFKIKSLKWAKKSADVTLVHKDSVMQIKHTVKLSNNIKGSNCVAVTIQNTKTKAKMTAHTGKNGGSVSFPIENKKTRGNLESRFCKCRQAHHNKSRIPSRLLGRQRVLAQWLLCIQDKLQKLKNNKSKKTKYQSTARSRYETYSLFAKVDTGQ